MKEKLVLLTALMHQARECLCFGTHIDIDGTHGDMKVHFSFEDKFTECAKALGQEVTSYYRDSDEYPYKWVFTYNGVTFFTFANKEYTDAEITAEPESV